MNGPIRKTHPVEFRTLAPDLAVPLGLFFEKNSAEAHFHPHPMTQSEAVRVCAYCGDDLYAVAISRGQVLAYGMLRGWDQGYTVPSLGIIVAPEARGTGLASIFTHFLHHNARLKGAEVVRLKVYPDNLRALALYRSIGYCFDGSMEDAQLVGFFDLGGPAYASREK